MAQEKVSMRKIREILRLRYDFGLQQDQIARSCNLGQSTVHRYLERLHDLLHASTVLLLDKIFDMDNRMRRIPFSKSWQSS